MKNLQAFPQERFTTKIKKLKCLLNVEFVVVTNAHK